MADCIKRRGFRGMAYGSRRLAQTGGVTGFEASKIEVGVPSTWFFFASEEEQALRMTNKG
jgi:hypothetical protein